MSRSRFSSVSASSPEPGRARARGRRGPARAGKAVLFLLAALGAGGGPLRGEIVPPYCPEAQKICLQADRDGGVDNKTGTAYLVGNVVGVLKQHDLRFRSELLKAFRNEAGEWARLELDQGVVLEQPERRATGDHAVIENVSGLADLQGTVTMSEPFTYAEGEHLHLVRVPPSSTLTGTSQRRAFMRHEGRVPLSETDATYTRTPPGATNGPETVANLQSSSDLEAEEEPAGEPSSAAPPAGGARPSSAPPSVAEPPAPSAPAAASGEFLPDTLLATSDEAIFERDLRQAHYKGDVVMIRREMGWKVWAQKVDLEFSEDQRLIRFDAEGDVRIEQPGRVLVADEVHSQNELDTLLLIGKARAKQAGQFDLASDRIEVYTKVQQGFVQSEDRQRPIRLTLDVGAAVPYRLDAQGLDKLREQGLPALTLGKLAPLRDRTYPNRSQFLGALRALIRPEEAELYQDTIAEAARTGPP